MCLKRLGNRLQLQFNELQYLLFIDYDLQSVVNPHIWHSSAENRLVKDLERNQQSGFAMWKETPISCPVDAVQILLVTWRVHLRCDAVFMTSSPSSSLRFSLLAVLFRTTLNKITSRLFQLHLRKAPFCSGISFHLFIFTYFPAFTIP